MISDLTRSWAVELIGDTELRLSFWRDGSTNAERLASATLRLSGYEEVDPQNPLGGPDGKKDLLCQKGGLEWVAAVYFPNGPLSFNRLKKKFQSDLEGAPKRQKGFVFVTNQTVSPSQRKILEELTRAAGKELDVIHLQRLQSLLDQPTGYGVRIQYLRIPMTIEDQLSWSADAETQTAKAISSHTRELRALRASVDGLNAGQKEVLRTMALAVPSIPTPDLLSASLFEKADKFKVISSILDPSIVLLVHRLVCFDLPSRAIGRLRTMDVWIGDTEGKHADHIQPPPPGVIELQLTELCDQWRNDFQTLQNRGQKLEAMAKFHAKFLIIHPFLDGNGRAARAILMQQCLDLFGKADMTLLNRGADYYLSLKAADKGDYGLLVTLFAPVIEN